MKKIPTIFMRNLENMSEITREHHPMCGWVFNGEGVATRKYDGTCVLIKDGVYYKRREVKKGKITPDDFIECEDDLNIGKKVGWVSVNNDDKADRWHLEALGKMENIFDGTYELCGPKIRCNPEHLDGHYLINHDSAYIFEDCPRTYDELKKWIKYIDIEGIVFHHSDGRMAKIKKKDFGFKRFEYQSTHIDAREF